MPWLSIVTALLAFFAAGGKKKENRTKALLAAGLVGAGTYYTTHETKWGQKTLGELDGYVPPPTSTDTLVRDGDGNGVTVDGGKVVAPTAPKSDGASSSGFWDVLKSWGAAGTAGVVGVAGAATGAIPWLPVLLIGGAVLLLTR